MKDKNTGKMFYFVNTHLDHKGKEAQRKGLDLIVSRIDEINPKGYPMVLTGDFNIKPDNVALVGLEQKMQSARKIAPKTDNNPTFNGWGKAKSDMVIDYVYVQDSAHALNIILSTRNTDSGNTFLTTIRFMPSLFFSNAVLDVHVLEFFDELSSHSNLELS